MAPRLAKYGRNAVVGQSMWLVFPNLMVTKRVCLGCFNDVISLWGRMTVQCHITNTQVPRSVKRKCSAGTGGPTPGHWTVNPAQCASEALLKGSISFSGTCSPAGPSTLRTT